MNLNDLTTLADAKSFKGYSVLSLMTHSHTAPTFPEPAAWVANIRLYRIADLRTWAESRRLNGAKRKPRQKRSAA